MSNPVFKKKYVVSKKTYDAHIIIDGNDFISFNDGIQMLVLLRIMCDTAEGFSHILSAVKYKPSTYTELTKKYVKDLSTIDYIVEVKGTRKTSVQIVNSDQIFADNDVFFPDLYTILSSVNSSWKYVGTLIKDSVYSDDEIRRKINELIDISGEIIIINMEAI